MAIPLTSVRAPAALSDGDPELVALGREAEDSDVEGGMDAVGSLLETVGVAL